MHKLSLFFLFLSALLLSACASSAHRGAAKNLVPFGKEALTKGGELADGKKDATAPLSYADERRYNELFLEAVRQKQMDHYDAEHELLAEALRIKPNASEALYEMALLKIAFFSLADSAERGEGLRLLEAAQQAAPNNAYYKETLANYLASTGEYNRAIGLLEELSDEKLSAEHLATLVQLYEQSADYPGAIRALDRLELLEGKNEALSLEMFQVYAQMGDEENAYRVIEELCAEYPLDLRYRVLLGDLYDRQGHHEMALATYKDVLAAEPSNSYAQMSLLAYYKAAKADSLYLSLLHSVVLNPHTETDARIEALRAYALDNVNAGADPTPVLALFRQALAMPQENRATAELCTYYMTSLKMPQDSLIPVVNMMLDVEPDYSPARLQLLQFALLRRDLNAAENICREGELYDPANLTFVYYHGVTLYQLERTEEAIRVLKTGALRTAADADTERDDVEMRSDLYALLGDILHDVGRTAEAYAAYDRALEYNRANWQCLNNYAYFLSLDGERLEEAEMMSRRTVEQDRKNPTYLDTYAWVLFCRGNYQQARVYIDQTLLYTEEKAENASLFDHAGDIYLKLGKRTEAAKFWKTALRLSQDAKLTRLLKKKLRLR